MNSNWWYVWIGSSTEEVSLRDIVLLGENTGEIFIQNFCLGFAITVTIVLSFFNEAIPLLLLHSHLT